MGITNDMTGDEYYLFDGFDVINKLTIIHEKRLSNNGNNASFRYIRRNESDSSSESEGSDDENIEAERNEVLFV